MNFIVFAAIVIILIKGLTWKPSNVLSCGQWGYIGDDYNAIKLSILGLYNQSRGEHSCGIHVDGVTTKGVDKQKLWMDFIAENPLPLKLETDNKIVLGHARQASSGYGKYTADKQHPFHIGNKIGQQNGTIKNDYALGNHYGIPSASWDVDTQLLYIIMDQHGYDVLEQYTGFAALLWTHQDSPNELFLFKGASQYVVNEKGYYEERPLYYLREENGYYFSSMENSLKAIRSNPKHEIGSVVCNEIRKLYFDEDGRVRWNTVKKVNRDGSKFVTYSTVGKYTPHTTGQRVLGMGANNNPNTSSTKTTEDKTIILNSVKSGRITTANKNSFKLRCTTEDKTMGKTVSFLGSRYKVEGKLLNGCFHINESGTIVAKKVPHQVYYFFAGVMIRDRETYIEFCRNPWRSKDNKLKKHKHYFQRYAFEAFSLPNWVTEMSHWSKHPVKVMDYNCSDKQHQEKYWYKGVLCDDIIAVPKFQENKWYFRNGDLLGKVQLSDEEMEKDILPDIDVVFNVTEYYLTESGQDSLEEDVIEDILSDNNFDAEEFDKQYEDFIRVSSWDKKYKTLNDAMFDLTTYQVVALHSYVDKILNTDCSRDERTPDDIVREFVISYIATAIKNECSIRDEVEDPTKGRLEQHEALIHEVVRVAEPQSLEIYARVKSLYDSDMVAAFENYMRKSDTIKAEIEDVDNEDESEELIQDSLEEVEACLDVLDGICVDLGKHKENTRITDLDNVLKFNKDNLRREFDQFVEKYSPKVNA